MNKVSRFARDTKHQLASIAKKGSAAIGTSLAFVGTALATPTDLGTTAAAGITEGKGMVETVQTAMLGVIILLLIFALVRRSMGK